MSTDKKQDKRRVLMQYLKQYGTEDQEGFVDAVTWAAEELAKEWGWPADKFHLITGFNWASEVAELAAKHRRMGAQFEAAAGGESSQDVPTAIKRKYPPLIQGSGPWRKHKQRWERIRGMVNGGKGDEDILDYLKQLDRPVRNGPLAHQANGRIKLACSRKTLGRTIEAGLAGDFED